MKKIIASIFAFAAVLSLNAASITGEGKAVLSQALSIEKPATASGANFKPGELNFGNIAIGTEATKFTIDAATGAMIQDRESGAGGAKATTSVTPTAAEFLVKGTSGLTFTVSPLVATDVTPQGTSLTLTSSYDPNLDSGGNLVKVGGELTVPSTANPGSVAYTFDVVVNYN